MACYFQSKNVTPEFCSVMSQSDRMTRCRYFCNNCTKLVSYELEKNVLLSHCIETEKREGARVHAVEGTRLRGGTRSRRNTAPAFSPY